MGADDSKRFEVEVVYAQAQCQTLLTLEVSAGTSALDAVLRSGLLERHPELDRDRLELGVFGRPVTPGQILEPGDRVEIYRPLAMDPREARRQRALHGRTMRDDPEPE